MLLFTRSTGEKEVIILEVSDLGGRGQSDCKWSLGASLLKNARHCWSRYLRELWDSLKKVVKLPPDLVWGTKDEMLLHLNL